MTAADCQDAILEHLRKEGGWIPIRELARWIRCHLDLSMVQGGDDLRTLVQQGLIERRATRPEGSVFKAYEYRARPVVGRLPVMVEGP